MRLSLVAFMMIFFLGQGFAGTAYSAPKEMPADFEINYQFSGGMSPTFKIIQLKIGDCKYNARMNYDEEAIEYYFKLKKEDLALLYNELNGLHAFTLKSKKVKVYDRGGESISYTINKKTYIVSNSGMSFIIGAHQKSFSKSVLLITNLADKYRP